MKKNVTYIDRAKFEALIEASGLHTSDKAGWTRVEGQKGNRIYVPKTKRVGRVDVAFAHGGASGVRELGGESFGAVTAQLDMSLSEDAIMENFAALLDGLRDAAAPAPRKRAARAAQGEGETPQAEPAQGRKERLALIAKVAAEKGVTVSAQTLALDAE
jgi:hypothetical protein